MNSEHIEKIKQVLIEWNPLGDLTDNYPDLNNYETEVIDILFFIDKSSSIDRINKVTVTILTEAFNIDIDLADSRKYAEEIRSIIKK